MYSAVTDPQMIQTLPPLITVVTLILNSRWQLQTHMFVSLLPFLSDMILLNDVRRLLTSHSFTSWRMSLLLTFGMYAFPQLVQTYWGICRRLLNLLFNILLSLPLRVFIKMTSTSLSSHNPNRNPSTNLWIFCNWPFPAVWEFLRALVSGGSAGVRLPTTVGSVGTVVLNLVMYGCFFFFLCCIPKPVKNLLTLIRHYSCFRSSGCRNTLLTVKCMVKW